MTHKPQFLSSSQSAAKLVRLSLLALACSQLCFPTDQANILQQMVHAAEPPASGTYVTTPSFPTVQDVQRLLTNAGVRLHFRVNRKLEAVDENARPLGSSEYEIVVQGKPALLVTKTANLTVSEQSKLWVKDAGFSSTPAPTGFPQVLPLYAETPAENLKGIEAYERETSERGVRPDHLEVLAFQHRAVDVANRVLPPVFVMPRIEISQQLKERGFTAVLSADAPKLTPVLEAAKAKDWPAVARLIGPVPTKPSDLEDTVQRLTKYPEWKLPVRLTSPQPIFKWDRMVESDKKFSWMGAIVLPLSPEQFFRVDDGELKPTLIQIKDRREFEVHPDKNGFIDHVNIGPARVMYYLDLDFPPPGQVNVTKALHEHVDQFAAQIVGLAKKVKIGEITAETALRSAKSAASELIRNVDSVVK